MQELTNRNAIVTGASRGIGVHIARALADEGMNVVLTARSAEPLEKLAAELESRGKRAVAIAADVGDLDSLDDFVKRAEEAIGPPDVLVNNAALESNDAFVDFSDDRMRQLITVDLISPMLLTRKILSGMIERDRGHVVNIASLAGKSATPYNVPYSAAKAGLIAFTHGVKAELADSAVSISVVSPGFVSEAGMFADKQRDLGIKQPALLGMSSPDEVTRAVLRAIKKDVLDIIVNPGPMRLMGAMGQLFPKAPGWVANRMGVGAVFRTAARRRDGKE